MPWPFSMPKIDHERLLAAIRSAEAKTTGEIRVLVARHRAPEPIPAAQHYFDKLGMAASAHRNGVLIFFAPQSRRFAVIGDKAVHEKCGDAFWAEVARAMEQYFRAGKFTDGLVHGVDRAGELLARHFPRSAGEPPAGAPKASEVD